MSDHAAGPTLGYEPAPDWDGFIGAETSFAGDATAVAVNSRDQVFVFNRGPVPVIVFDPSGRVLDAWGAGEFTRPHSIRIDREDNVFLVESQGGHVIQKRSPGGELLMELGRRGKPSGPHSGVPFNSPTDIAIHRTTGDLFVSDGYGNSRIHRFDAQGNHLLSWGEPGGDPGQFYVPHSLAFIDDEHLVVCDRENFRLQIFTLDGVFVDQWHAFRPCAVTVSEATGLLYVAELGPAPAYHGLPDLGSRIRILTPSGQRVGSMGARTPGHGRDQFMAPHSLAFDSSGALYVAEVSRTWADNYLRLKDEPTTEPISLQKWIQRGTKEARS